MHASLQFAAVAVVCHFCQLLPTGFATLQPATGAPFFRYQPLQVSHQ